MFKEDHRTDHISSYVDSYQSLYNSIIKCVCERLPGAIGKLGDRGVYIRGKSFALVGINNHLCFFIAFPQGK